MKIFIALISLLIVSCSTTQKSNEKTVVLLHGAHLDGSSWARVATYLAEKGRKTISPTLPGRGNNKNVDLNDYAKFACDLAPDNSILVGHSQGGAIANQMLGICPDKIIKIIYVSAVVPLNGERPFDLMEKRDEKAYTKTVVFKNDRVEPRNRRAFLRAMAQDFDYKTAKSPAIHSEPTKVGTTVLKFESAVFDSIPKAYIVAALDQIITPQTQQKYIERTEFQETYSIGTGHLPMVTKPDELAELILRSSVL